MTQGRRPELVGGGLRRSAGAWLELPTRKGQREPAAHDERVLGEPDFVMDLLADADWERRQLLKARARAGVAELAERVAAVARYLGVATSTINRQAAEGDLEPQAKLVLKGLPP